ncbi:hypothetical protein AOE01nite_24280 [Acetobacter oeni]|uniref:Uncharacterized protein n=1 Tax=Acetobacter oeni TaxID=304077 RepID=A0A511XMN1_9PROT|nr:hypothetical protein AOE01nite_24280 [Acetobacter oeni]
MVVLVMFRGSVSRSVTSFEQNGQTCRAGSVAGPGMRERLFRFRLSSELCRVCYTDVPSPVFAGTCLCPGRPDVAGRCGNAGVFGRF